MELPPTQHTISGVTFGADGTQRGQLEVQLFHEGVDASARLNQPSELLWSAVQRTFVVSRVDHVLLCIEDRENRSDGQCGQRKESTAHEGLVRAVASGASEERGLAIARRWQLVMNSRQDTPIRTKEPWK